MAMLSILAYHDNGENAYMLTDCIERLIYLPSQSGYQAFVNLHRYPALLLAYAAGISALASKRFRSLAAILRETRYRDEFSREKRHASEQLHVWSVFERTYKWVPRPNADREYTPANNYLFDRLRPVLQGCLPNDVHYEETFDTFEYLLALNYMDLSDRCDWSPIGRFGWRYKYSFLHEKEWRGSPMADFVETGLRLGENWELLKAGFFQGSVERFKDIARRHHEWLQKVLRSWW